MLKKNVDINIIQYVTFQSMADSSYLCRFDLLSSLMPSSRLFTTCSLRNNRIGRGKTMDIFDAFGSQRPGSDGLQ